LNIAPKPLILIHGVWEDYEIWEPLYQNLLTENHSYQWKAYPVGSVGQGRMEMGGAPMSGDPAESVYENADRLAKYVKYAQTESNAWHVDMVAHSTGGLVARLYMHKLMPNVPDARPQVKHLIMLGTPNGGVPCADVFAGKLNIFKEKLQPVKELTNEEMLRFNQYVANTGGTKFSALAGNPVPIVCGGLDWNDGFVTVKSALYGVADTGQSNDLNRQLVDDKNFGNFVKPHLVTGPQGTYPIKVKNDPTDWKRWQLNNRDYDVNSASGSYESVPRYDIFHNVSFERNSTVAVAEGAQIFVGEVKLAPRQVMELDAPVAAAANFGITFMAAPFVSATLINDRGGVVSKSDAGSALAGVLYRMLLTTGPVGSGAWKLRLENTSNTEQVFAGFGWSLTALEEPGRQMPAAE
jgi:pimeloyl-ACP methyl ester carboxylesterase